MWQKRGYGTNVGQTLQGRRLTHLAFADDVTLIARSWLSFKRMVLQLRDRLRDRGLMLHPSKCKAQANVPDGVRRGMVDLEEGFALKVLEQGETLEVLGTNLSLEDPTQAEVQHRIAVAWRKFWAMRRSLLNVRVSRRKRLQLFDTTVGSSLLYGTHAWTPRVEEFRNMRTVQNSMLRRICGFARGGDEPWLDFLRRATRASRKCADNCGVRDWIASHAERKWYWAGHVARRPVKAWLWQVASWRDAESTELMVDSTVRRPSRRRWMKWEDALRRFVSGRGLRSWMELAQDKERWNDLAGDFQDWFW